MIFFRVLFSKFLVFRSSQSSLNVAKGMRRYTYSINVYRKIKATNDLHTNIEGDLEPKEKVLALVKSCEQDTHSVKTAMNHYIKKRPEPTSDVVEKVEATSESLFNKCIRINGMVIEYNSSSPIKINGVLFE